MQSARHHVPLALLWRLRGPEPIELGKVYRVEIPASSSDDDKLAGVATFPVEGLPAKKIEQALGERHRVRVRFRKRLSFGGVRVSPHVYTSFDDLDRFVTGLRDIRRSA